MSVYIRDTNGDFLKTLDFFLPGLFSLIQAYAHNRDASLSATGTLLGKGQASAFQYTAFEQVVWALIHQQELDNPPAGVFAPGADGYCYRLDPVHLEVGMSDVVLHLLEQEQQLTKAESQALEVELNHHLQLEKEKVLIDDSGSLYLCLPESLNVNIPPTSELAGQGLKGWLQGSEEAKPFRQLFTELQMVLHGMAFNEERERKGLPVVNGLWFWGGSQSDQLLPLVKPTVVTDHVFAASVAQQNVVDLPEAQDEFKRLLQKDHVVLISKCFESGWFVGSQQEPVDLLERLETEWFTLVLEAVRSGDIGCLRIISDNGRFFTVTRRALKSFWRRQRSLQSLFPLEKY